MYSKHKIILPITPTHTCILNQTDLSLLPVRAEDGQAQLLPEGHVVLDLVLMELAALVLGRVKALFV